MPPPRRWLLLLLLALAMIIAYAQRGALSFAAPFMMKDLGLSAGVMGILLSAFSWPYALLGPAAGLVVDRFGVKRAYACGFAFWSMAATLTGWAGSLQALIAARVAIGVGQSVAFPASARAVSGWFRPGERGAATGGYLTGVRLGQALIGGVSAILLANYGWRTFFIATGLAPLIWLVPWLLSRQGAAPPRVETPSFASVARLLRHRSVAGLSIAYFAYMYCWNLYVTWLPGYLALERKFGAREMSIWGSLPFLIAASMTLTSGGLSDWVIRRGAPEVRVRKTFVGVGFAVAALIVPASMVDDKMTAVWLFTISLCGLGAAVPNIWSLTQAVCAQKLVGRVSGVQHFAGNVGAALAAAATGWIVESTQSFSLALSITAPILLLGLVALWVAVGPEVETP